MKTIAWVLFSTVAVFSLSASVALADSVAIDLSSYYGNASTYVTYVADTPGQNAYWYMPDGLYLTGFPVSTGEQIPGLHWYLGNPYEAADFTMVWWDEEMSPCDTGFSLQECLDRGGAHPVVYHYDPNYNPEE